MLEIDMRVTVASLLILISTVAAEASAAGLVSMQSLLNQGYRIVSGSPEQILVLQKDNIVFICESNNDATKYTCHVAH